MGVSLYLKDRSF